MSERANNLIPTACHSVSLGSGLTSAPLFQESDFNVHHITDQLRSTPSPLMQRTVFQPSLDWQCDSASAVLEALRDSQIAHAEDNPVAANALVFRRQCAVAEVNASASDFFTAVTNPFSRQIRIIQCNACRRPLLITRLFQHLSYCPAFSTSSSSRPQPPSLQDDPMLDLVAAAYTSQPSSPRQKPSRTTSALLQQSSNFTKEENANLPDSCKLQNRPVFSRPREEDDWETSFKLAFPPQRTISKYRRRRVFLPAPQPPSTQRKRTLAVERRSLEAAAVATLNPIPARSPTHQHQAYARDPLRNAVITCASTLPWTKLVQVALPVAIPRDNNPRQMLKITPTSENAPSVTNNVPPSPPTTPTARGPSSSIDPADMEALATTATTPALAGTLLYLRGQGLRPLANTPLSSLDAPQLPIAKCGAVFHGQKHIAPMGTYFTDPRNPSSAKFSLPTVAPLPPLPASTTQQQSAARSAPPDPRVKKTPTTVPVPTNPEPNGALISKTNTNADAPTFTNSNVQVPPTNIVLSGPANNSQPPNAVMPLQQVSTGGSVHQQPQSGLIGTQRNDAPNADVSVPHTSMSSLPPPSPSPSHGKRPRSGKQRSQSVGPKGQSTGKNAGVAARKVAGGRSSPSVSSAHGRVSSTTGNMARNAQSPASSLLQQSQGEPSIGVPLGASVASSPNFGSHGQPGVHAHPQNHSQAQPPAHQPPHQQLPPHGQPQAPHQSQPDSRRSGEIELGHSQPQSQHLLPQSFQQPLRQSQHPQAPQGQLSQPQQHVQQRNPTDLRQLQPRQTPSQPPKQAHQTPQLQHQLHQQRLQPRLQPNAYMPPRNVGNDSSASNVITGQELSAMLGGAALHGVGEKSIRPRVQAPINSGIPGERASPAVRASGKGITRSSQSPSQGSILSGDRSSFGVGSGPGSAYEAILRSTGLTPSTMNAQRQGPVPLNRVDNNDLPLDFLGQSRIQSTLPIKKGATREDVVSELRRVMSNAGGKTPSYTNENGMNRISQPNLHSVSPNTQTNDNVLLGSDRGPPGGSQPGVTLGQFGSSVNRSDDIGRKSYNVPAHLRHGEVARGAGMSKEKTVTSALPPNLTDLRKSLEGSFMGHGQFSKGFYNSGMSEPFPNTGQVGAGFNPNMQGQANLEFLGMGTGGHPNPSISRGPPTSANNAGINILQGFQNTDPMQGVHMLNGGGGISNTANNNAMMNLFSTPAFTADLGTNALNGPMTSNIHSNGMPQGSRVNLSNVGVSSAGIGVGNVSRTRTGGGAPGTGTGLQGQGTVSADVLLEQMLSGRSTLGARGGGFQTAAGLGLTAGLSVLGGNQPGGQLNGQMGTNGFLDQSHGPGRALQALQARLGGNGFEEGDNRALTFDFDESDFGP